MQAPDKFVSAFSLRFIYAVAPVSPQCPRIYPDLIPVPGIYLEKSHATLKTTET